MINIKEFKKYEKNVAVELTGKDYTGAKEMYDQTHTYGIYKGNKYEMFKVPTDNIIKIQNKWYYVGPIMFEKIGLDGSRIIARKVHYYYNTYQPELTNKKFKQEYYWTDIDGDIVISNYYDDIITEYREERSEDGVILYALNSKDFDIIRERYNTLMKEMYGDKYEAE